MATPIYASAMASLACWRLKSPLAMAGFAVSTMAPFEAWLYHTPLMELAEFARAFPQTTIILNHVGGPVGIGP